MTSLADRIEALQGPAKSMLRKISPHFREGDFFRMDEGERMPRSLIETGLIQKQHFSSFGMNYALTAEGVEARNYIRAQETTDKGQDNGQ